MIHSNNNTSSKNRKNYQGRKKTEEKGKMRDFFPQYSQWGKQKQSLISKSQSKALLIRSQRCIKKTTCIPWKILLFLSSQISQKVTLIVSILFKWMTSSYKNKILMSSRKPPGNWNIKENTPPHAQKDKGTTKTNGTAASKLDPCTHCTTRVRRSS